MKKNYNNQFAVFYIFCVLSIAISTSGCRKLVETDPPSNQLTGASVFLNDATSIGVVTAFFDAMNSQFQGSTSISVFTGLSSDELTLYNGITGGSFPNYFKNTLYAGPTGIQSGHELWSLFYPSIFKFNAAIEGLSKSSNLTPSVKQQLLGEVKFLRAFYYFYLVNLYGDVPLALSTDPEVNAFLNRSPKATVYNQIVADLKEAEELLSDKFLDATLQNTTTERVRPTKWAAIALLARVYLYTGLYDKAEENSTLVINNSLLFGPLPSLNNVFLKNSLEAIWQLQPTNINYNTIDGVTWIIPAAGPNTGANPVYLSKALLNSFEVNDQRKAFGNWVDTTIYNLTPSVRDTVSYSNKYKINASPGITSVGGLIEYFMVLRLAEQYLIRAEARAQLGNVGGAQADLNTIRTRAGLPNTTASSQTALLDAILHERQVELFCEWGHRWFDLKRTGKVDVVMNLITPAKSNGAVNWQPYQALYPLPYTELQRGLNLVQNPGYN